MPEPTPPSRNLGRRALLITAGVVAAAAVTELGILVAGGVGRREPTRSPTPGAERSPHPRPTASTVTAPVPTPTFNRAAFSIEDPSSVWVVVNKPRALNPIDYAPVDLVYPEVAYVNRQPMRQEAATALVAMFAAGATEANLQFSVQSAYRSYSTQVEVYDDDVATNGQAYADSDTARPGHSEHQTGWAVDISAVPAAYSLDAGFGTTPQGQWLAANAWRFGFLLRYPADKVAVTGFTYEPWHFRYIGTLLSVEMHNTGVTTLEEFFGTAGGTSYSA